MHIHDATIYSERNYAAIVYFKQVIHFLLLEKDEGVETHDD